jgi:hypothetical protein
MSKFKRGDRVRLMSAYAFPTQDQIEEAVNNAPFVAEHDIVGIYLPVQEEGRSYVNPEMLVYDAAFAVPHGTIDETIRPVLCAFPAVTEDEDELKQQICFPEEALEYVGEGMVQPNEW